MIRSISKSGEVRVLGFQIKGLFFRQFVFPILAGILAGFVLALVVFFIQIDYKNYLRNSIDKFVGYHVAYEDTRFVFFPIPAIQLIHVRIYPNFVYLEPLARADKIVFSLSWKSLYGRGLVLNRIGFYRAVLRLVRYPDGKIGFFGLPENRPAPQKNDSKSDLQVSRYVLSLMQIGGFVAHDSKIFFKDEVTGQFYRFQIDYGSLLYQASDRSFFLESRGRLDGKRLDGSLSIRLPEGKVGFDSVFLEGRFDFDRLSTRMFQKVLNRFYLADYTGTQIGGFINFTKKPDSPFEGDAKVTVIGLALDRGIRFTPFTGTFQYRFSPSGGLLQFPTISISWPRVASLYGNGWLSWAHALNMHFNIYSTYGNYHSIIDLIQALRVKGRRPPPGVKVPGQRTFHLDLKKVFAYKHNFDTVVGDLFYESWVLDLNDFTMGIYGGTVTGNGSIDYLNKTFRYKGQVDNVAIADLIGPGSITGSLHASMDMNTSIQSAEEFYSEMRARGQIIIRNGELIGYANIMRPVASFGKMLNITGPSGKSTEFTRIASRYVIRSSRVYISNLDMTGVGLDAKGTGSIGFDKTIDMKVTLGMGGDLWKHVLKIPIIYDGVINQDYPYIDPIWVTAVAVGGGFLIIVPPYNPIQGAVVGSLLSDVIRDAYEGVKGWFSDDEEIEFEKELKEEFDSAPVIQDRSASMVGRKPDSKKNDE